MGRCGQLQIHLKAIAAMYLILLLLLESELNGVIFQCRPESFGAGLLVLLFVWEAMFFRLRSRPSAGETRRNTLKT